MNKKGRVTAVFKGIYKVRIDNEDFLVDIRGKLKHQNIFPAVGDYVYLDEKNTIIEEVLERFSKVSRNIAGNTTNEQIIATNIDYIFIVSSLNDDFNLSRLERYLTLVYDSGASPVFILTKKDLGIDIDHKVEELENIAYGVPIHLVAKDDSSSIEPLKDYLVGGKTIAFIGSSGVGKSTLLNSILGKEVALTKDIREDDSKGRHTTTHRELFEAYDGYIIDTPGMRELQLWSGDINSSFEDIEELSTQCKFRDCSHNKEPKCAVREAISTGVLDQKRFDNYTKLKRELELVEVKKTQGSKQMEKKKIINMMGTLDARKNIKNRIK